MPELLVSCQELSKAFGAVPHFEGLCLGVFESDGSGKSTLLKILPGLQEFSSWTRAARRRLRIGASGSALNLLIRRRRVRGTPQFKT